MKSISFPDCCAGLLLSGFGGTKRIIGQSTKYSDLEIKKFLDNIDLCLKTNYGFALLTLNNEQIDYMKPYLEKYEYKCIESNIPSPNHYDSVVSIYIKIKSNE